MVEKIDKKSQLLTIIKYGAAPLREDAVFSLEHELKNDGDFKTFSKLINENPELIKQYKINVKELMLHISYFFFNKLSYDSAPSAMDSLIEYIYDKNTTDKKTAKIQFPLYAAINLWNSVNNLPARNTIMDKVRKDFEEVSLMYDLITAVKIIGKETSHDVPPKMPEVLRSAIIMNNYIQSALHGKHDDPSYVSEDVETIKNAELKLDTMLMYIRTAEEGYVEVLENNIFNLDKSKASKENQSEQRMVLNALLPYAALKGIAAKIKEGDLVYEPDSHFENTNKVYLVAQNMMPVFELERLRSKINEGLNESESKRLFELNENANDFSRSFSLIVKSMYLDKLCKDNNVEDAFKRRV
jgi:hypothetical protein